MVYSNTNASTGTNPDYGLECFSAGIIGKYSTQPTGAISNEYTERGGVIR
jgi:hypothetical protein